MKAFPARNFWKKLRCSIANETRALFDEWRDSSRALEERHAPLLAAQAFLVATATWRRRRKLQNAREALPLRLSSGQRVLADETFLEDFMAFRHDYETEYIAWHSAQNDVARLARSAICRAFRCDASAAKTFDFDAARFSSPAARVAALLETENAKRCSHDGRLRSEPTCAACRLVMGQNISLAPPRAIEAVLESGLTAFRALLREEMVRDFLQRDERGAQLLEWNARDDASPSHLTILLNDAALQNLDEALKPRRHVARSWRDLKNSTPRMSHSAAIGKSCSLLGSTATKFSRWMILSKRLTTIEHHLQTRCNIERVLARSERRPT